MDMYTLYFENVKALHSGILEMPEWSPLVVSCAPIVWFLKMVPNSRKIHKEWLNLVVLNSRKNGYLYIIF